MCSVEPPPAFLLVALMFAAMAACVEARTYESPAYPPNVPSLRLPQNGAYVGSVSKRMLQPRFSWGRVDASAPVVYELQYSKDPQFVVDVTSVLTEELQQLPDAMLDVSLVPPVGARYYWHVRACVEDICSEYSSTWCVNVGRSDVDYNGDGYADILIGTPYSNESGESAGRAYIYYGGPGAIDVVADGVLAEGGAGATFGWAVSSAGDINGDGFSDVIVGAPFGAGGGRAYLYLGGNDVTFDPEPDAVFAEGPQGDGFGRSVATGGDVNGDGYPEIVIGAPARASGRAYVYSGRNGGSLDIADWLLADEVNDSFADTMGTLGDFNSDGFSDLFVNELFFAGDEGYGRNCTSHIYYGDGGEQASPLVKQSIREESVASCWSRSVAIGDVNRDGFSDLMVVKDFVGRGRVEMYLGSESLMSAPTTVVQMENRGFYSVDSAGDINGDGLVDLLAWEQYSTIPGGAVYFGTMEGETYSVGTRPSFQFTAGAKRSVGAGDLNGDGIADVLTIVGSTVLVYLGGAGSFDAISDAVFNLSSSNGVVSINSTSSTVIPY